MNMKVLIVITVMLFGAGCDSQQQSLPPVVVRPPVGQTAREVSISGVSKNELRWVVTNELRNLGYQVITRSSFAHFKLNIKLNKRGDREICTAILYDRTGQVVAQGKGESKYFYFRASGRYTRLLVEKMRYEAEVKAVLEAVRSMAADHH